MEYRRVHIRVPLKGQAILSNSKGALLKAKTIDISRGGLAVTHPEDSLELQQYNINVITEDGLTIKLKAELVRETENSIGFKTSAIDHEDLKIISDMVYRYQETEDFIKQIDEHNIFDQHYIDDEGNELEVTFDVDSTDWFSQLYCMFTLAVEPQITAHHM